MRFEGQIYGSAQMCVALFHSIPSMTAEYRYVKHVDDGAHLTERRVSQDLGEQRKRTQSQVDVIIN